MKAIRTNTGFIAIVKVRNELLVKALPQHRRSREMIDHLMRQYSAVVIDVRDIWHN